MSRQDDSRNGAVKDYTLEISLDGHQFYSVLDSTFELTRKPQSITFKPMKAKYIRLICKSDYSGQGLASISELGFLGTE